MTRAVGEPGPVRKDRNKNARELCDMACTAQDRQRCTLLPSANIQLQTGDDISLSLKQLENTSFRDARGRWIQLDGTLHRKLTRAVTTHQNAAESTISTLMSPRTFIRMFKTLVQCKKMSNPPENTSMWDAQQGRNNDGGAGV